MTTTPLTTRQTRQLVLAAESLNALIDAHPGASPLFLPSSDGTPTALTAVNAALGVTVGGGLVVAFDDHGKVNGFAIRRESAATVDAPVDADAP